MHQTPYLTYITRAVLVIILLFFAFEVIHDVLEGESSSHYIFEGMMFVLATVVLLFHVRESIVLKRELDTLKSKKMQSVKGLREQIERQFSIWHLTPSEKEVAWLIIKGFAFLEIAHLRSVKEKTVRQQAISIYAKSGTSNRNDFTAKFIDEILNLEPA